jgi:hypothetical protein
MFMLQIFDEVKVKMHWLKGKPTRRNVGKGTHNHLKVQTSMSTTILASSEASKRAKSKISKMEPQRWVL